jgi:Zn-dependent protease with chaperone function
LNPSLAVWRDSVGDHANSPISKQRLPWSGRGRALGTLALLLALLALFLGCLLTAVFELFRFVDFLLATHWQWDTGLVWRIGVITVVCLVVVRIAWQLAVALVSLLTAKHDPAPELSTPIALDRDETSALFETVADVCRELGAPEPHEVRVSHEPECFVAERRQFSFFPDRQLILVLGLPQLLVMSIGELKMIVAHEMEHFRNGDTTLTVFLFRFYSLLKGTLDPMRKRWYRLIDPVYWLFWIFYHWCRQIAGTLQRRQELRADAASAALYGGDMALRTLLTDWMVVNQFESTIEDYQRRVAHDAMSAQVNIFRYFVDRWRPLDDSSQDYLEQRLVEQEGEETPQGRPTVRKRIALMRSFPRGPEAERRPAVQLLPETETLETRLHQQWLAEEG